MVAVVRLESQGTLFAAKRLDVVKAQRVGGGLRGVVTGFSAASRRRLIEVMARLDVENVRCTFMTLTFKGCPDLAEARRAFKMFSMRLRRAYPDAAAMWRQEKQKRGSIHYHLIWFNLPYVPQKDLRRSWMDCTGEVDSGLHIKLLSGKRQAMYYVSKYVAKASGDSQNTLFINAAYQHEGKKASVGRQWGYINKAALPFGVRLVDFFSDDDTRIRLWETVFKLSGGRAASQPNALRLYCDDPSSWVRWAVDSSDEGGKRAFYRWRWQSLTVMLWQNRDFSERREKLSLLRLVEQSRADEGRRSVPLTVKREAVQLSLPFRMLPVRIAEMCGKVY